MACIHKFYDYLHLDYLNFTPTTLIVGTFNPTWPENNYAHWFYGRTDNNNFWNVLPRIYNEPSLTNANHLHWKQFCQRNLIAITDLISCIGDANRCSQHDEWLRNYSDKKIAEKFHNYIFVNIVELLETHPTVSNVYLTRGMDDTFWRKAWHPIKNFCEKNGKTCKELLTPSGYAFYQQGKYNKQNPNNQLTLPDFILMRWREKWHQL